MPRAGSASVACSCWFIAHRAQVRRRGVGSVAAQVAQANSGGWPAHGPQIRVPSGAAAEHLVLAAARAVRGAGRGSADSRHRRRVPSATAPSAGRAWPQDRHWCTGWVQQIMQRAGRCGYRSVPAARRPRRRPLASATQRPQRSGWPAAARSRIGRSWPHPPHRRGGRRKQLPHRPVLAVESTRPGGLPASGAGTLRRLVARPADSGAVLAAGRHRAVLAADPARPGRLQSGGARRAQRPGGRPGAARAGPAAPLARLLPPAAGSRDGRAVPPRPGAAARLGCRTPGTRPRRCPDTRPRPAARRGGSPAAGISRSCGERAGERGQMPAELAQRRGREAASVTRRRHCPRPGRDRVRDRGAVCCQVLAPRVNCLAAHPDARPADDRPPRGLRARSPGSCAPSAVLRTWAWTTSTR